MGKDPAWARLTKLVQQNAVLRGVVSLKDLSRARNPTPKPLCDVPMMNTVGGSLKAESGIRMSPMGVGEGVTGLTHPSAGEKIPGLPLDGNEGGGFPTPHGADHTGVVKILPYTLQQIIDAALVSGIDHGPPRFGAGGVGHTPHLFGAGGVRHVPSLVGAGGVGHAPLMFGAGGVGQVPPLVGAGGVGHAPPKFGAGGVGHVPHQFSVGGVDHPL